MSAAFWVGTLLQPSPAPRAVRRPRANEGAVYIRFRPENDFDPEVCDFEKNEFVGKSRERNRRAPAWLAGALFRLEVFGSNHASATKVSSLSITSASPATIRICDSHR
jgi:hypothetical protein